MENNEQREYKWYSVIGNEKEQYNQIYNDKIKSCSRMQLFALGQESSDNNTPVSQEASETVKEKYLKTIKVIKSLTDVSPQTVSYLKNCKPVFIQKSVVQVKKSEYSDTKNYLVAQIVNENDQDNDLLHKVSSDLKQHNIDNFISPAGHVGPEGCPNFGIPLRLNDSLCDNVEFAGAAAEEDL